MLQDRLILSYLKRTRGSSSTITEAIKYEEIQSNSLYKVSDDLRIQFDPVMENVWSFSLMTTEGSKNLGRVYKVSESDYVARSNTAPNLESSGKNMVDAALELCSLLGEL